MHHLDTCLSRIGSSRGPEDFCDPLDLPVHQRLPRRRPRERWRRMKEPRCLRSPENPPRGANPEGPGVRAASLSGEADRNTSRLLRRSHRATLTGLPTGADGDHDPAGPACGQPEVPLDAAPLTISTNSAFDGRCAANFRGSLWSTWLDFAT